MAIAKRAAVHGGKPGSGAATTPALNIGTGDAVVFYYNGDGTADLTSVGPDSAGNTYTQIAKQSFGTVTLQVYASYNATAGAAATLGFNSNGNTDGSFGFFSVSGATTTPLDVNVKGSGTPVSLSSGTLAQAAEMLVLIVGTDAGGPFASPSGYTEMTEEPDAGAYWTSTSDYKVVASTTTSSVSGATAGNERGVLISFKESAGGTSYSLAYDAASYSLTGSAETLQATRALAVAVTSYAVTAAAETLSVGRKLDVAAISYALTAADVTLTYTPAAKVLDISPASYAVTASAQSLVAARALGVDATSYALTGSAETLAVGRALDVSATSYGLTPVDVTLSYAASPNKALSIDPAAYALTAGDVGMAYSGAGSGGDAWGKKKRRAQVQAEVNARNLEILKADIAEEMKAEAIVETVEYDDDEDVLMLML